MSLPDTVELATPNDWPYWCVALKNKCRSVGIWSDVDPDIIYSSDQEKPVDWLGKPCPSPPNLSALKEQENHDRQTKYREHKTRDVQMEISPLKEPIKPASYTPATTEDVFTLFDIAYSVYEILQIQYHEHRDPHLAVFNWILETVDFVYMLRLSLQSDDDGPLPLRDTIVYLRREFARTQSLTFLKIQINSGNIMSQASNQGTDPAKSQQEWMVACTKAMVHKIREEKGGLQCIVFCS
ncbi:hypothetical protein DSL72_001515 [Monilinia vaccinii-corymbosi]|uniref:Uncharacterized protein n=1 Tax=Monilinia vaccinii-corymbosi TaxID=61207 RepID=A0A8A3P7I2_9HELO|nr:hypothetical protein DSL72_001515 [Monilinia vaccinii-corymbosi]